MRFWSGLSIEYERKGVQWTVWDILLDTRSSCRHVGLEDVQRYLLVSDISFHLFVLNKSERAETVNDKAETIVSRMNLWVVQ